MKQSSLKCAQLKSSTKKFYECNFFNLFLNNVLHPGGLKLTEQLGELADIRERSIVLDVATGRGVSAIFLAKKFSCKVVGVDLSKVMIEQAADSANTEKVTDRVDFEVSDAERLPFKTGVFDAVISECSLCLFPTKRNSLSEMFRVLKKGGRIALSDVTLKHTRKELRNKMLFFSCIAGAESLDALRSLFEDIGFVDVTTIDASQAIVDIYKSLKKQSSFLKAMLKSIYSNSCTELNIEKFGRITEQLILEGKLGYGVLIGKKPFQD